MSSPSPSLIVIFGGGSRLARRFTGLRDVRLAGSRRGRGLGPFRATRAALRAGRVRGVVVVTRWNSHSEVAGLKRLCRRHGVSLRYARGGASSAADAVRHLREEVCDG